MTSTKSGHETVVHPIPPLFDENSRILILGSFPSVKSRQAQFFYGHPQNRFWSVLAALLHCEKPHATEQKRVLALENHIALWDSIHSCDIVGSSDSSIQNAVPNDLSPILETANIQKIFCNGSTSYALYHQYIEMKTGIAAVKLPSTSPANAAWSMEKLCSAWEIILKYL